MKANRFILLAFLFLVALNVYQFSTRRNADKEIAKTHNQISALTDSVSYYKNELGQEVAQKEAFKGTVSDLKDLEAIHTPNQNKLTRGVQNIKERDLKAAVQIQEVITVKEVFATKTDSGTYAYADSLLAFQVTVLDSTARLDSLSLVNDKTVIFKDTRKGTVLTVTNSNPYFRSADIDGILVPEKKKWYNSKAVKVGLFVAGFAMGTQIVR